MGELRECIPAVTGRFFARPGEHKRRKSWNSGLGFVVIGLPTSSHTLDLQVCT